MYAKLMCIRDSVRKVSRAYDMLSTWQVSLLFFQGFPRRVMSLALQPPCSQACTAKAVSWPSWCTRTSQAPGKLRLLFCSCNVFLFSPLRGLANHDQPFISLSRCHLLSSLLAGCPAKPCLRQSGVNNELAPYTRLCVNGCVGDNISRGSNSMSMIAMINNNMTIICLRRR